MYRILIPKIKVLLISSSKIFLMRRQRLLGVCLKDLTSCMARSMQTPYSYILRIIIHFDELDKSDFDSKTKTEMIILKSKICIYVKRILPGAGLPPNTLFGDLYELLTLNNRQSPSVKVHITSSIHYKFTKHKNSKWWKGLHFECFHLIQFDWGIQKHTFLSICIL